MAFVKAAKVGDLPAGTMRQVEFDGQAVALANVDGKIYAVNGTCLHVGGPIGEGDLAGNVVTCPWHGWEYDISTGRLINNPTEGVETYSVEIRGEEIFVDIGK